MPSLKTSIRLTEQTQKQVKIVSEFGRPNWSKGVNQLCQRYETLVKHNLPELSKSEKTAMLDALNGHWFNEDIELEAKSLNWVVSECIEYSGSFVEHLQQGDTDPKEFLQRAKGWTIPERIAIIHMTQEFWHGGPPLVNHEPETDE